MDINLEKEMKCNPKIIEYCKDDDLARQFYAALCNMRWRKKGYLTDEDKTVSKLKGEDPEVWSCSWRYAGGIIADIRTEHHGKYENYMDFYCSGKEGHVSDIVNECFAEMGWEMCPWPSDEL